MNNSNEKIYTSQQILVTGFIGGPFALIYIIGSNLSSFGYEKAGKLFKIIGIILIALIIIYGFKNTNPNVYGAFGKIVGYLTFGIGACFSVKEYRSKVDKFIENGGQKHTTGDVAKVILSGILGLFLLIFLTLFFI